MRLVRFANAETLRLLPNCADCELPASDGRHSSPAPHLPCRDGFPAGPTGCANPELHHLYRLPASFVATEPVPEDSLPEWAR